MRIMIVMRYKIIFLDFLRIVFRIRWVERVLVKCTMGKAVGSLVQKITPSNYTYKNPTTREVERGGIRYSLNIYDTVDWYIYYGFISPHVSDVVDYINPNDIVIDVGGNNGEVALRAGKKVGKEGAVISFEPLMQNVKRFNRNLFLNPLIDNVVLISKGVGDREGEFTIVNDRDDNLGMGWIEEGGDKGNLDLCYSQVIIVTTLDSELAGLKLEHIDFIKIDVEGFELKVLMGGEGIINAFRPKLFIETVEEHLRKQGASVVQIIKYLDAKRYVIYDPATGEKLNKDSNFCNIMDILALPM